MLDRKLFDKEILAQKVLLLNFCEMIVVITNSLELEIIQAKHEIQLNSIKFGEI